MVFTHPSCLWLLLLAPAIAYAGWRIGGARRWTVAALRGACIAVFAIALAGPMIAWHAERSTSVTVIDISPAISNAAIEAAAKALPPIGEDVHVIAFSNRAEPITDLAELTDATRLAELRKQLNGAMWQDDAPAGGANLAAALQLASASIPPAGRGEVKLIATGFSNHEDAAAEAWRLAERGIAVTTTAADVAVAPPAFRVRRVSLPGRARVGQTLQADVEIESTAGGKVTIRLTPGRGEPVTAAASVAAGTSHITIALPLKSTGLVPVKAAVWSGEAGATVDDSVQAAVQVRPASNVLLVQHQPDPGLAESLSAMLSGSVTISTASPDAFAAQLPSADAVILADVPADDLSADSQQALTAAVRHGTGLLLTGAARSFGPGGYDDSQLATLLPVKMPQQAENIDPSTTLVLIIDTSGSMMGERMDLAKEIARLAMAHLKAHDKVGIVEFYGGKRWAAPIQSAANVAIIQRALDRLTAGGGTTLYPAVEEAAFALRNIRTRGKELLILSDGMVEEAPFATLVRSMAEDGVTVSTAQLGKQEAQQFGNLMPDVARWGNGRFYTVPDAYGLPDIQFKQPQISLVSPLVQTSTDVVPGDDALLRGTAADAFAPVNAYVRTESKPTADILLKTSTGDPLMARWRYGAGYVAAMPTQLGSAMTADLGGRPAFAQLLSGLMRQLDDGRGEPLAITTTVRPAGVEVNVVATTNDPTLPTQPLTLSLSDAAGASQREIKAEPVTPGHWNILLPGMTAGAYAIHVAANDAVGEAGVALPPPQAIAGATADHALLTQIASFSDRAAERAAELPAQRAVWIELQKALTVLAIVLLLLQVAARRWPMASKS